ncbi:MAG: hypothetical protein H8E38_04110 [SAR324 cluster bacterium]|nr:hypothetical protein [SAR324 cluster bacterium]MBL7035282.1 hypothetical protein [SAR324 cluster bacterium]
MNPRVLISCQNLGYSTPLDSGKKTGGTWDIRNLNLDLYAGERVCFHFHNEEQKEVLWRLFQQKLKPKTGSFRISGNLHIQTDSRLWAGLNKNATLQENLNSRLFSTRPWFSGQRKNLETLMDRLCLSGQIQRLPVQELNPENAARFWALMLVAAQTTIVLVDQLFSQLDEISLPFIQEWLAAYAGSVILFGEHTNYFKAVKTWDIDQQIMQKPVFNSNISFSADGLAKIC